MALVGQKVGGLFLSPTHSGAVGAFLVVPFAMLGARIKTSPPAIVMMLAAFWALVPGALSFESLGEAAAGEGDITTLGTTVAAIFSIALGTLIGWSVFATIKTRRRALTTGCNYGVVTSDPSFRDRDKVPRSERQFRLAPDREKALSLGAGQFGQWLPVAARVFRPVWSTCQCLMPLIMLDRSRSGAATGVRSEMWSAFALNIRSTVILARLAPPQ